MLEKDFTRLSCLAFQSVGAKTVVNQMGRNVSSVPDRTVVWKFGNFFIEFKGARTKIMPGQKIWMEAHNLRFPCAVVLKAPGFILTPSGRVMSTELSPIDHPAEVLERIHTCLRDRPWAFAGVDEYYWNNERYQRDCT